MTINTSFSALLKLLEIIKKKQQWINKQEGLSCLTSLVAIAHQSWVSGIEKSTLRFHRAWPDVEFHRNEYQVARRPNDARYSNFFDFPATFVRIVLHLKELRCIFDRSHEPFSFAGALCFIQPRGVSQNVSPVLRHTPCSLSPVRHQAGLRSLTKIRLAYSSFPAQEITRSTWGGRRHRGACLQGKKPQHEASEALQCWLCLFDCAKYTPV